MGFADNIKASIRRSAALDFLRSKSIPELEQDVRAIFPDLSIEHLEALERLVQEELAKPERQRVSAPTSRGSST